MPIDPSIPLSVRPVQMPNPLEVYAQLQQMQVAKQQAAALQEQRLASAAQRQAETQKTVLETEAMQRQAAQDDKLRGLFASPDRLPTPGEIINAVGAERGMKVVEGLRALHKNDVADYQDLQTTIGKTIGAIKALPEDMRQNAYETALGVFEHKGWVDPKQVQPYSPDALNYYQRWAMTPKEQWEADNPKPVDVAPGNQLVNPQTGQVTYTAPPKEEHSPAYKEWQDAVSTGYQGSFQQYQNEDANRKRPVVNVDQQNDAKAIADAIIAGDQPPDLGRLYSMSGKVRGEIARQGYNLTNAQLDWDAAKKHLATLNGAQQTRMRQAIDNAAHSLDVIDSLADQWKGGRYPLLNKATLAAAKQGAMGKDAQSIATQLEAQISDVTSELGNVYMGGNSPTDHALGLAAKNLSANWSQDTLKDLTKLARTNLLIRANSIKNAGAVGVGGSNTYLPQPSPAAAPDLVYDPATKTFKKPGGG